MLIIMIDDAPLARISNNTYGSVSTLMDLGIDEKNWRTK